MEDRRRHWEHVYETKADTRVSWYRPHLDVSLRLIARAARDRDAPIIDVGGGSSTLADDLDGLGYTRVTVLDVSERALQIARDRLGDRASRITWLAGDVTTIALDRHAYALWHDRAVFHFLTAAGDRAGYVAQVRHALRPGGRIIIATFAVDGPAQCSGLPTERYSAESLSGELGTGFRLIEFEREDHVTPSGTTQRFTYGLWERLAA